MAELYKSFIKDHFIVIFGHILIYAQGLILMPVIIKTVGVTVYGGYILIISIVGFLFGISSFGIGFKNRRFLPAAVDMQSRRTLYYPQLIFQIASIAVLSFFLLVISPLIKDYFLKGIELSIILVIIFLFTTVIHSQATDYFRYTGRIGYFNFGTTVLPYAHIGTILSFIYLFHYITVNLLIISQIFCMVLITIPLMIKMFSELGFKMVKPKINELRGDIRLGFPLYLVYIADFILTASDRYLIAFYLSVTHVGYYAPGYALGSLIVFIPKAMGTVLPQLMCRAADNDNKFEAHRMMDYAIKIYLLLAIPFIIGCIALGKPILTILANQDVAEKAFWIAPIVALGTLFLGLNIILSNVLYVRLKTNTLFKVSAFAALFNLLANSILLYLFRNIIIAAITTLLSYMIAFIYLLINVKKEKWGIDFGAVAIVKCLFASLVMGLLLLGITLKFDRPETVSLLVAKIALGIFVYVTAVFSFKTFSSKEISYMKGIFQ